MISNLNSNKPWSNLDDQDIRWGVEPGSSDYEIADFLCRDVAEVLARMAELGIDRPVAELRKKRPAPKR